MDLYDRRRMAAIRISEVSSLSIEEQIDYAQSLTRELETDRPILKELSGLYKKVSDLLLSKRLGRIAKKCEEKIKEYETAEKTLKEILTLLPKLESQLEGLLEESAEAKRVPHVSDVTKLPAYAQIETIGKPLAGLLRKWANEQYNATPSIEDYIYVESRLKDHIGKLESDQSFSPADYEDLGVVFGYLASISDQEWLEEHYEELLDGEDEEDGQEDQGEE